MPELPDVEVYCERITALFGGQTLSRVRLSSPFVLRSVSPLLTETHGKLLVGARRLGKRIVLSLSDELFLVIHLMISGRLRQKELGAIVPRKVGLLAFDFETSSLLLTEASSKKRASLFVIRGEAQLSSFERGGVEPLAVTSAAFAKALTRENRTLKRALTDPRIVSGVGNAYSDEILWSAGLSPTKRTQSMNQAELSRLHKSTKTTLREWTERLRQQVGDGFPDKVTAFHEDMAVHGRFGKPCRRCNTKVQRVRFADNELNYCPRCQTDGKLLADRGLSKLLGGDWPKTIHELEERADFKP
ncbi:MAG TPA: DNA-formamidopyrimidine glycosylase family protein [Polyangiaceae bacterium]|nr:DNA-formamidopyrimidine glycosylase family protein [Polyangiaceae bacterium]HMR73668.1 DNA-formamidopyrimidine glycosylase family protein [Polyangiaceae bacterium]